MRSNFYVKLFNSLDHIYLYASSNKIWILLIFVINIAATCFFLLQIITRPSSTIDLNQSKKIVDGRFLDNCQYIYIDMGTNIGIQIRKLYEPNLFPGAQILPLFRKIFGNHSNEVCSIGFEANPFHDSYLKEFEQYCLKRKWRVKIFTSTAVSIVSANLTFYTEPTNIENNQWGATLKNRSNARMKPVTVPSIDMVSWFRTNVLERKYSKDSTTKVMMKSDIEGHDQVVLTAMILGGVYCSIDLIYAEHVSKDFIKATEILSYNSKTCQTKLIYMDDESYYKYRFPFNITNNNL